MADRAGAGSKRSGPVPTHCLLVSCPHPGAFAVTRSASACASSDCGVGIFARRAHTGTHDKGKVRMSVVCWLYVLRASFDCCSAEHGGCKNAECWAAIRANGLTKCGGQGCRRIKSSTLVGGGVGK